MTTVMPFAATLALLGVLLTREFVRVSSDHVQRGPGDSGEHLRSRAALLRLAGSVLAAGLLILAAVLMTPVLWDLLT